MQQINTITPGLVGVHPNVIRVLCDNTLEQVTTAGFLSSTALNPVSDSDMVLVKYVDGLAFFTPSFSNGIITLELASGTIPDDSITTAKIEDGAVTEDKIADDSITSVKIEDLAVGPLKLANNAVGTAKIVDDAVTLAKLAPGITPSHIVFAAASVTTAGGSATETITVAGVTTADIVFSVMKTAGITPVTILRAAPGTGNISIVFSANPSTDTVISYQVLRAAS